MLRIALALSINLAALPALAQGPHCVPLEKLKKEFDPKTTHFLVLTPGQINFARGGYVATPPINGKLPAGDAAILAEQDGAGGGVVLWTRGPLVCEPTPVPPAFVRALKGVKTGALDADGNEI